MFMAKNELSNAVTLAKVQTKNNKRGLIGLGAALFALLLVGLITAIEATLSYAYDLRHVAVSDNFFMLVFILVFGVTALNFTYRSYNRDYAVYPQTNFSRFLANQITTYGAVILMPVVIMLIYLIQYAVMALIASGRDNVHLVFDFNIAFVFSGLVITIIYLALIAGTITFISTIIRKFRLYAIIFFAALIILFFGIIAEPFQLLQRLLSFFVGESNIWLFILKGTTVWAGLFVAAFVVNKYTVYYKAHSFNFGKRAVTGIFTATICAAILVLSLIRINAEEMIIHEPLDELFPMDVLRNELSYVLEIDLSNVPAGSDINVVASGDAAFVDGINPEIVGWGGSLGEQTVHFADGTARTFPGEYLIIIGNESIFDIDGDTLFIHYRYPIRVDHTGGLISHLMNPQFDIRFEENTLYVHYTYDKNVTAVTIPVWSFMRQFDSFRGQNVVNELPGWGWSTWSRADIWLWVE